MWAGLSAVGIGDLGGVSLHQVCRHPPTLGCSPFIRPVRVKLLSQERRRKLTRKRHSSSLELDNWTEKHIMSMQLGGNRRLDQYLKDHNRSPLSSDLQLKYDNPEADEYRYSLHHHRG